ncbi:MAG: 23S rRNA (adenine(2503)-C(2))-methyltransferase RlmN, partial [bacterium]
MENTDIRDSLSQEGDKADLKSMTLPELEEAMKSMSFPAFRARQLYQWMHVKLAPDYASMTNLPAAMKEKLEEAFTYTRVRMIDRQISRLDGTQKFLFAMPDNSLVESVFMKYKFGNSICISSQVG